VTSTRQIPRGFVQDISSNEEDQRSTSRHEYKFSNLESLTNVAFGNTMNFPDISGNRCCGWAFSLRVKHFEDPLQRLVVDDSKRAVAFENL